MGWMTDRQDAYNEGHIEGLEQGRLEVLVGFVQDGIITMEQAAARVSMTVEEFEERMK